MAKIDLRKSVKQLGNFLTNITVFGTKMRSSDQFVFDRRGAVRITDKEVRNREGDIVKIRGISDSGSGSSMVISRPTSGTFVDASKAMDSNHGWVYACIKAIADEIANTEFKLFQIKDDNHEEVEEHEILDFLDAVNDFQTGPEFKHMLTAHLELTGNAFILLEGVKNYDSKPTAMYLLDPGRVKIILDKTTYPFRIARYEFTYDSRVFTYQPYEIVQIKYPNPSNQHSGLGTVQAIAEWIDNDNYTTEFLRHFFINGAQLGLTFETDMSGEDQIQALRDSFIEQHSGVNNAYKAMFLPKGVTKPKSGEGQNPNKLEINTISDTIRDKILAGFRVSKTILGTAESDTNRSTAETADYVFAKRTIKPKMMLITSYLNEFLVPRFDKTKYLTFVDSVPEDKSVRIEEMKSTVGGMPVMSVNEAREVYLGLPEIEGGDKLLAPNTYVPAENSGEFRSDLLTNSQKKVSKQKMGYVPARVGKSKTQFAKSSELRMEMKKALSDKIADIVLNIKKKTVNEMTNKECDSVILKEKAQRTGKYKEQFEKKIKELNNIQKKEVLSNLEEATKSVKAVDPKKLFNKKGWINIFVNALTPIASDLFSKESEEALRVIDSPGLDVANTPSARSAIDTAMELMSENYNETTIMTLESKLTEGLEQGFGIQKLGELVSEIYEWSDTVRAERVALTESNRITNTAGKIAWKESGVVNKIIWITSERDNVCGFCQDLDGTEIGIDENFYDKGDEMVGAGGEVMTNDYSDMGGPPAHPNCHCGIKPVVDTEKLMKPAKEKDEIVSMLETAASELDELEKGHDHKH